MSKKNRNPVRVKDPLSENFIVALHPYQGFDLHLTPFMGKTEIKVNSDFFRVDEKQTVEGHTIYRFGQIHDLSLWSEESKTYLGDVTILSDKSTGISLKVMLEPTISRNILTIINPSKIEVRLDVGEQLEVVLFDDGVSNLDLWDWQFVAASNGLRYELVDQQILNGSITKQNQAIRRSTNSAQLEQHFWFKSDFSSKIASTTLAEGVYDAGKLVFDAGISTDFRREVSIRLSVKELKKNSTSITNSSSLIKTDSAGYIIRPPTTAMILSSASSAALSTETGIIRPSPDYGWPEHSHHTRGRHQDWNKGARKHIHVSDPYDPSRRKKIKLKKKAEDLMEAGCSMLFFENSALVGGTFTTVVEVEEDYTCLM